MKLKNDVEQHIALFGGPGSGKTVLLSSFYGLAQEPEFLSTSPYRIVSEDGRGNELHANYLKMKNANKAPRGTRLRSFTYRFRIRPQEGGKAGKKHPFDAIQFVFHDYPGEWLEGPAASATEEERRLATFKDLLQADVAVVLVDGRMLLDNGGEEERYLKALFTTMRQEIAALKDALTADGKLIEFPRVWMIALSKADLHPDLDVFAFRDLVIERAAGELGYFKEEIRGLLKSPEALSVGDDYVLLSSASFSPDGIDVSRQVGVPLLIPIATLLPMERIVSWAKTKALPIKAAESLLGMGPVVLEPLLKLAMKKTWLDKLPTPVKKLLDQEMLTALEYGLEQAKAKAHEISDATGQSNDKLAETVAGFTVSMDEAERDRILLRSVL